MARLPAPEDFGIGSPQPARSITEYQPLRVQPATEMGQALGVVAKGIATAGDIYQKHIDDLDSLAADNALNALRQKRLDLTLGDNGFQKLRGQQVTSPERPILADYSDQLQLTSEGLMSGLKTPAAKAKFQVHAANEKLDMQHQLLQHITTESDKAIEEGAQARIKTEVETAAAAPFDTNTTDQAVLGADSAAQKILLRRGYDQNDPRNDPADPKYDASYAAAITQYKRETVGAVHSAIVNGMLASGRPDDIAKAEGYMAANKLDMTTSALVTHSQQIQAAKTAAVVHAVPENVIAQAMPAINPSPIDRLAALAGPREPGAGVQNPNAGMDLHAAVRKAESNGNMMAVSPKGATSDMQVMPATAADPGLGVRPAADDSLAEKSRVGHDYLDALMARYGGSQNAALAAYNWGLGRVDKLLKRTGTANSSEFLDALPAETRDYVNKINGLVGPTTAPEGPKLADLIYKYGDYAKALAAYKSGEELVDMGIAAAKNPKGVGRTWSDMLPPETLAYVSKTLDNFTAGDKGTTQPTLLDLKNRVAASMQGMPIKVIDEAQARVATRWADVQAAQKQRADETMLSLKQRMDTGQVTDLAQVTPDEWTTVGNERGNVMAYLKGAQADEEVKLKMSPAGSAAYFDLKADPFALKNAPMGQLWALRPLIGKDRVDSLLAEQAELIKNPVHEKEANIDASQFRELARRAGFDPGTKDGKVALEPILNRVEEAVVAEQNKGPHPHVLTRAEKEKIIVGALTTLPALAEKRWYAPQDYFGTNSGEFRGAEIPFPGSIVIPPTFVPPDFKAAAVAAAAAKNQPAPNDIDLRKRYDAAFVKSFGGFPALGDADRTALLNDTYNKQLREAFIAAKAKEQKIIR